MFRFVYRWLRRASWLCKGYSTTTITMPLPSRTNLDICQLTPPLQPPARPQPMSSTQLSWMKRHGFLIGIEPCSRCATRGAGKLSKPLERPFLLKVPCSSMKLLMCLGRCRMRQLSSLSGNSSSPFTVDLFGSSWVRRGFGVLACYHTLPAACVQLWHVVNLLGTHAPHLAAYHVLEQVHSPDGVGCNTMLWAETRGVCA